MDKKALAVIDREIAKLEAKRKRAEKISNAANQKWYAIRNEVDQKLKELRNKRVPFLTDFKKGDIVKCYDPVGLYEVVEVQSRCYASNPNQYELLAIKLTKTGNWGYCASKRVLDPEKCKKWTPDPVVEKKKK